MARIAVSCVSTSESVFEAGRHYGVLAYAKFCRGTFFQTMITIHWEILFYNDSGVVRSERFERFDAWLSEVSRIASKEGYVLYGF